MLDPVVDSVDGRVNKTYKIFNTYYTDTLALCWQKILKKDNPESAVIKIEQDVIPYSNWR